MEFCGIKSVIAVGPSLFRRKLHFEALVAEMIDENSGARRKEKKKKTPFRRIYTFREDSIAAGPGTGCETARGLFASYNVADNRIPRQSLRVQTALAVSTTRVFLYYHPLLFFLFFSDGQSRHGVVSPNYIILLHKRFMLSDGGVV